VCVFKRTKDTRHNIHTHSLSLSLSLSASLSYTHTLTHTHIDTHITHTHINTHTHTHTGAEASRGVPDRASVCQTRSFAWTGSSGRCVCVCVCVRVCVCVCGWVGGGVGVNWIRRACWNFATCAGTLLLILEFYHFTTLLLYYCKVTCNQGDAV